MNRNLAYGRRRRGSTLVTMLGVGALICTFGLFFLEVQTIYEYHFAIQLRAQRAVNTTVEYAMDDRWRADGYNYMDVDKAEEILEDNLRENLNVNTSGDCHGVNGEVLYSVSFSDIQYYDGKGGTPAGITVDVDVEMNPLMGGAYGLMQYDWTTHIESTNFRTDHDMYAGE